MRRFRRPFKRRTAYPTNRDRSFWAKCALDSFAMLTNSTAELRAETREVLTDLLADLMHYCDAQQVDFASTLERARRHYVEESR